MNMHAPQTRTVKNLYLLLILGLGFSLACRITSPLAPRPASGMGTPAANEATKPSVAPGAMNSTQPVNLLIGKWKDDATGQVVEYTASEFILYDFPAPDNILIAKYTLPDDHTIQLDIQGSYPVTFLVKGDKLTKTNRDGTFMVYSRIK
jgi:hypothetical protein